MMVALHTEGVGVCWCASTRSTQRFRAASGPSAFTEENFPPAAVHAMGVSLTAAVATALAATHTG
jgi:hypothetical protein